MLAFFYKKGSEVITCTEEAMRSKPQEGISNSTPGYLNFSKDLLLIMKQK